MQARVLRKGTATFWNCCGRDSILLRFMMEEDEREGT